MTLIRISALITLFALIAPAQQNIGSGKAEEVVIDLVVKDKRGKPVKDITASEVEVTDNGAKQTPTSFRFVDATTPDPTRPARLVTLVIEQISEDARRLGRQAVNDLLKNEELKDAYFAVAGINQQLILLQPFTKDRDKVRAAATQALSGAPMIRLAEESNKLKAALRDTASGATDTDKRLAQVMLDMTNFQSSMAPEEMPDGTRHSTRLSLAALQALARGQASIGGRKAIVYLTEGMFLPPYLDEGFRSMLSVANRVNVTFYPFELRGVAGSQTSDVFKAMKDVTGDIQKDVTAGGGTAATRDQIRASDRAEEAMRKDLRSPLRNMAEGTGGLLVADANSFSKPVQQIAEDLSSYYEVTYNPGITNYDGQFRRTEVKVDRKDVKVASRNGYFALPADVRALGLLPFEAVLIKALAANPLPRDVQYRSAAVKFAASPQGTHEEVLIEVPLANLTYREDPATKTYNARVSVMAVLKDQKGEIVQKLSRDLPLRGPLEQMEQVKKGNFIYKEHFTVPPGRYTLDTAVMDREANKIGTKRASMVIAPKPAGVAISTMTMVRRYQPKATDLDPHEDFEFQGGRITPTLGNTITNGKGSMLSIFFVVYPDPAIAEKPSLVLEYIKDGQVAGRGAVELPAADAKGRIPYVMSSSAETMPPGNYEIRAVVKQGSSTAEDRAFVTVEAGS